MRPFIIKSPPKGRSTCSMVHQFYDTGLKRTRTKYLGSFSVSLDPHRLPLGLKTRSDVSLSATELSCIEEWLARHGTFGQLPVMSPEQLQSLRERVRAEFLADPAFAPVSDIELAVRALAGAAEEVQGEATRLRAEGMRLSTGLLAFTGTDFGKCRNEMDRLKVRTNLVRSAYRRLETAMKNAGVMKRVAANRDLHPPMCIEQKRE